MGDLKAKSGVEVLSVEEDGPAPKVVLKGTDAQVKSAVKLVKKLLEDHTRRAEERKNSKDETNGDHAQMNGHDTKKGGDKNGKAKGKGSKKSDAPTLNIESTDMFPTLGGAPAAPAKKGPEKKKEEE